MSIKIYIKTNKTVQRLLYIQYRKYFMCCNCIGVQDLWSDDVYLPKHNMYLNTHKHIIKLLTVYHLIMRRVVACCIMDT